MSHLNITFAYHICILRNISHINLHVIICYVYVMQDV